MRGEVHPDLKLDLRAALTQAVEEDELVRAPNLRMGSNGSSVSVEIIVERVSEGSRRNFIIVFKESNGQPLTGEAVADSDRDEHVLRLEAELRSSNERLQATIEELESTNEELKSANEEYQSLNEELQSANEELETSKEELQSINEELTTVNGELSHRVQEIGRANSDLKNLLESTQIATVFLDNELRVMNFTPAISDIFPLVEADIGRPITHIRARIPFEDLLEDVRRVMRTLATVERDMVSAESTHYMVRVLPYRSVDNFIGGVVITFTDLTTLTQAQMALRQSEERFRVLVDLVPELVWSSDPTGWTGWLNRRWFDYTGQTVEQAQGWGWLDAIHPDDRKETRRQYEQAMAGGDLPNREHRIKRHDGEYRWFLMRAEPSHDEHGSVVQWFGTATDVHEQRTAFEVLSSSDNQNRLLLAELQHRVRNTLAVVRSIVRRSAETSESMDEYTAHLDGRLAAFARVQAAVTRNPAVGIDLAQIIAEELQAHRADEGGQVEALDGPRLMLQAKAAELIGLAIHELAINAVKYGALSQPDGRISVRWSLTGGGENDQLILKWRESGVAVTAVPDRRGFGTELLERTIAYELDGSTVLDFSPTGVHCTITLPLGRIVLPAA